MEQAQRSPQELAYNRPENWDVWHNPTDQEFIAACHIDHNQPETDTKNPPHIKPSVQYYRFVPHSDTRVPVALRYVIQHYKCSDPKCLTRSDTRCMADHPGQVISGQCPQLIRKGAPHIKPNALFSSDFSEEFGGTDVNGYKRWVDNKAQLQPKLEELWKKITTEPPMQEGDVRKTDPTDPRPRSKVA